MAGKTLTSSLIVRLIDQVSAPARKIGGAILGIERNAKGGFGGGIVAAMDKTETSLANARAKMLDVVGGLYLLRGALGAPLNAAANFETALEDIGQKAGIPQEKLAALGEQIKQIARDTNQSTISIASAIDNLVGQGASENVALAAAGPIGKAATAYRAATDDLAAAAYAAVNNLQVGADDIPVVLDMMAEAGKQGAFELRDMAKYFPALAAQYQGLGQTGADAAGDLAAALQIVRTGTGDASTAATNLQNVLQKVYANTTINGFKKLGIDIRKEMAKAAEAGMTPIEAIAEITNKALGGDLSKLGTIFEDAQVQAGMRSLIQNMDEYRRIRGETLDAKGVVDEDFARRLQTAQGAMDRWTATIENLNISIGATLVPLLNGLLVKITPIIGKITDWAAANPELSRTIVAATAGLVGFRIAVAGLSFVGLLGKSGALSLLSIGFNTIGKAAIAATSAIKLQSALASMGGMKMGGFDALVTGLRGMAMALPGVSGLAGAIGALVGALSAPVLLIIGGVAAAGLLIWKYWDRLSSIFGGVAKRIGEELAPALDAAKPLLDWFSGIGKTISTAWEATAKAVGDFFGALFGQEKLTDEQKAGYEDMGYQLVDGILAGMKRMWDSIAAWFAQWPQMILDAIGSIDIGSIIRWPAPPKWWSDLFGGGTPEVSSNVEWAPGQGPSGATGRARGGNMWAGSTYQINEKGEEFFSPRSSVFAHKAGEGPGAVGVTFGDIIINGVGDPLETARLVRREIAAKMRHMLDGAHYDSDARY